MGSHDSGWRTVASTGPRCRQLLTFHEIPPNDDQPIFGERKIDMQAGRDLELAFVVHSVALSRRGQRGHHLLLGDGGVSESPLGQQVCLALLTVASGLLPLRTDPARGRGWPDLTPHQPPWGWPWGRGRPLGRLVWWDEGGTGALIAPVPAAAHRLLLTSITQWDRLTVTSRVAAV